MITWIILKGEQNYELVSSIMAKIYHQKCIKHLKFPINIRAHFEDFK